MSRGLYISIFEAEAESFSYTEPCQVLVPGSQTRLRLLDEDIHRHLEQLSTEMVEWVLNQTLQSCKLARQV